MNVMYQVMGILHSKGLPLVFKGSMVLRALMEQKTELQTFRFTEDFDIDWVAELMSPEDFVQLFQEVMDGIDLGVYKVICTKEPINSTSGTFEIYRNGELEFSIDLSRKRNGWWVEYVTPDGVPFRGSSVNRILVDKLAVLSGEAILRRPQDMYDLYVLSHVHDIGLLALKQTIFEVGRKFYDFSIFRSNSGMKTLEEAYDSVSYIINPPKFAPLYGRVHDFCMPFMLEPNAQDMEWIVSDQVWVERTQTNIGR